MELLYKRFSPKIIVDAYPSHFVFTRPDTNFSVSVDAFLYMILVEKYKMWRPLSFGEEIPEDLQRAEPNIIRVDLFESDQPIKMGSFDREDMMLMFIEDGLDKCLALSRFHLKPMIHFLGADRFRDRFKNPREMFERILKHGSAGVVVFDRMEL